MAPVITKTTCELYKLRGLPHMGWADISIDAAEQHGRISVSSDWGNFANFWSHCGRPFKEFLAEIDIGYFAGKIKMNEWFDHEATVKGLFKNVLQWRREGEIDKENARLMWSKIDDLQYECNENAFTLTAYEDNRLWTRYDGGDFPILHGIDPMFRSFWQDCWLFFLEYLKTENDQLPRCGKTCATINEYEVGCCSLLAGHTGVCYQFGG